MSNRALKSFLIVSLAFNIAVIATVVVGWVSRTRTDDGLPVSGEVREIPIGEHGTRLSKCIGLSGKRADCFVKAMAESDEDAKAVKIELEEARREVFLLLEAEKPDQKAILAKVDEISALQGKLEKILVKRILDSRAVLEHAEDEKLLQLIRCSMRPGCMEKVQCPYNGKRKVGGQ